MIGWMIMTGICLWVPFLILILHKQKKIQHPQKIDKPLLSLAHELEPELELELEGEPEPELEQKIEVKPKLVVDPKLVVEPYPLEQVVIPVPSDFATCVDQACATREIPALSFEELLEEGFKEKEHGAYQQAAQYFYLALQTKPEPDLAYYLITDSYGLWKSLDLGEMAILKLEPYMRDFQNDSAEVWQKRLEEWFLKNQIQL